MCYSSQIAAAYQQYLKLTGAAIDLDQFRELYGFRHANSSIRIPRAVDQWFNEPKNADESSIKERIDQHRAEAIAKLEGEVFVQRERLADAERKLQTKPMKAAPVAADPHRPEAFPAAMETSAVSPSNRQSNVSFEHRCLQLRALSALPQCSSVQYPIPDGPPVRTFAARNGARDADKLGAHLIGR
jgi:hypothetical protein